MTRTIKTLYNCDRCHAEFEADTRRGYIMAGYYEQNSNRGINTIYQEGNSGNQEEADMCRACLDGLQSWWRDGAPR